MSSRVHMIPAVRRRFSFSSPSASTRTASTPSALGGHDRRLRRHLGRLELDGAVGDLGLRRRRILLNPIAPVYLDRETWQPIDVFVALAFLSSLALKPRQEIVVGGSAGCEAER